MTEIVQIPLIGRVHIGAMSQLVISLIWFGYIAPNWLELDGFGSGPTSGAQESQKMLQNCKKKQIIREPDLNLKFLCSSHLGIETIPAMWCGTGTSLKRFLGTGTVL